MPVCTNIPDQRVNLDSIDIIQLLQRLLDLPLVALDVHDKHKSVVLLDLLHRALRVQRVDNHLVVIKARRMRDRLARILGRPRQLQCLGPVERSRRADLADFVRVDLDSSNP